MSSIIARNTWTLTTGERIAEIMTDGRVGAESDAHRAAMEMLGSATLSFRKSEHGALTFTYHDGARTFTE
ncbi:hypothetical protein THIBAULT_197 [Mycobacterium phage Thibault]|uniref:Uncharacterized protein n=2 Tax=Omegavirus TaxID=1623292 RepID=G1FGR0_9CAUD|nr:hypothetical protein CL87_gp186 [Mycobacterium phage Thibault]AEJ94114.1 hypothetical protein THIBAULT_197 [Mycobacterium phage Thibault]ATS93059.1 hypothetical protein SEA_SUPERPHIKIMAN_221 [Mycobacterium phage Superphikiman]